MKRLRKYLPVMVMITFFISLFSIAPLVNAAEIAMAKNTTTHVGDPLHPVDVYLVGQEVHYDMSITNTSSTQAMTIQITDIDPSGTTWYYIAGTDSFELAGPASMVTLEPLEVWEHDFHHILLAGDLYPHPALPEINIFTNTIAANGYQGIDIVDATVGKTAQAVQPEISVTKSADTDLSKVGDGINYTIAIENTGDWPLENITVMDDVLGDLSALFVDTLAPGETDMQVIPYVVMAGDPDPLNNIVEAMGLAEGFEETVVATMGPVVSDTATDSVNLFQPSITLNKMADTEISKAGDTVNYTITVTNTSSADSPNLMGMVVDAMLGLNEAIDLAPGEVAVFNVPYVVQAGDPDPLVNTATVTVSPEGFPNVLEASDSWTVDLVHPGLAITKEADVAFSKVGDTINYTIIVTNTGDVELINVDVTDSLVGDLWVDGVLGVGESMQFDVPYVVMMDDPEPLVNTATATAGLTGLPNIIGPVEDSVTVDLVHPGISLTKTCDPMTGSVGDIITYTITIANTGDVDLENVTVMDSLLGDLSAYFVDYLAVGASDTQQFTRAIEAGDPNPLVNTATVNATVIILGNPVSASDSCEVTIEEDFEGCTPGFWKNHTDLWVDYSPDDLVGSVFAIPAELSALADDTLMEALKYKGGAGAIGAARNLLRHATAALLNASHPDVNYAMSEAEIIDAVNAALASLDKSTIEMLKNQLDMYNNAGCSIDAHGNIIMSD